MTETQVAETPSKPPLLLRLHNDIVVVADATAGLRAWTLKGVDRLIAGLSISPDIPTSLAIDSADTESDRINISIGFDNGGFAIFTLRRAERSFVRRYTHAPSTNGAIHATAYASPYLLTMTGEPLLSLYKTSSGSEELVGDRFGTPRLVSSLRSHTAYPPTSLALRTSSSGIIASIAYAMPTWTVGWSAGMQEIRMDCEGTIIDSRMASASAKPIPISSDRRPGLHEAAVGQHSLSTGNYCLSRIRPPSVSKPTSLSYNHPYLLSAHADNTLTLYMVTSNAEGLSIGAGNRLWGHTSRVSGAHVGDRGKAVSVSASGDELRLWELEGGFSSNPSKRRTTIGEVSVRVHTKQNNISWKSESTEPDENGHIDLPPPRSTASPESRDLNVTKGWIAFDEERIVLLREKLQGAQAVVVYDFS